MIDLDALKVMRRLMRHGYKAYLVGGGVRDLLLEKQPKDFDLATDATTQVVRSLFRNSRIIGRRFPINHVYFKGNKIIEVATFRTVGEDESEDAKNGQPIKRDVAYGDPQSDSLRRDLTINGLFYDLKTFSIIDYVGGIEDLKSGIIRIIGEPETRINEDPVRMIRACRHAARTGFEIEPITYDAICKNAHTITLSSPSRVHEEFARELRGGSALESFRLMRKTHLLKFISPLLWGSIEGDEEVWTRLEVVLARLDKEVKNNAEISVAVLFAALIIGNVSSDMFDSLGGRDISEQILRFWQLSPVYPDSDFVYEQEQSDESESDGNVSEQKTSYRSKAARRKSASVLLKSINLLFLPLGVSRKERERMEGIFRIRTSLLLEELSADSAKRLSPSPFFDDALMLISLTTMDEEVLAKLDGLTKGLSGTDARSPNQRSKPPRRRRQYRDDTPQNRNSVRKIH